jgi:RimJ/RimL family protein N-acetyltransferase
MERLTDGILTLRSFGEGDVPAIAAACADPEIARFIPDIPQPYTDADARAYVARAATEWATGVHRPMAIAAVSDDSFLGAIEVSIGDPGSIGYWVAPEARGRGVATRALVLLSRWAVTEGDVARLELTTHPENVPSQRVADKAGFTREAVLRSHIRFREGRRDSVLFSLLPADVLV